ncbi:MAG: polyprenyl diphosphate synthase [Pelagibacteraceae bacterium]|nr:polyprenyl diphosphate synthase [Pelagibacteraceae bacterium]MCI5079139.1 polyprenyl diphosphate synthase [Pelagibacteraceae bacterium]
MKSPNHIAIIMDGNGRWGLKNFNNRLLGHEHGIKNVQSIVNYCLKIGLSHLTLFILSSDNLKKRNKKEIYNLFLLLEKYFYQNIKKFIKNKIKINFIGEKKKIPKKTITLIKKYENKTDLKNKKLTINLAFNYSSKKEIINSFKKMIKNKKKINEINFEKYLYTFKSGNPDFIIRTGGYNRLSDFLLWQSSYSEIFFLKKLWPDFNISDLKKIINKFKKTKRNFGS